MTITPVRLIALRVCPAAGMLVGCLLLMSPVMAQSTSSIATHLGIGSSALQKQDDSTTVPTNAEVVASSSTDNAESEVLALSGAEVKPEVALTQPILAAPPLMVEQLEQLSAEDPYERRLEGMRLSTILSRRPVLAADPLDARAAVRIDIEQNEVSRRWLIDPVDATLRQTLLRWSDSIGWQLIWEADKDFAIDARVELHTTFKNALETVMLSLADSAYPIQASLNRDARIVRVQRYMEQRVR